MTARYRADTHLPRHAFDASDRARAADIWRAFQELAVGASTAGGWPPARYRKQRCAFVMRSMSVVHHCGATYGDTFPGETWVRRMRRGMLSTREVRVMSSAGTPIASGTQEWVHVDQTMKPARGAPELISAFPVEDSATIVLPEVLPFEAGAPFLDGSMEFDVWHTWMDPLGHVNHPQYVEFADEGLARILEGSGLDPALWVPKAEKVTFLRGLVAGQKARVRTRFIGKSELGVVSEHTVENVEGGVVCARAVLHRGHPVLAAGLIAE